MARAQACRGSDRCLAETRAPGTSCKEALPRYKRTVFTANNSGGLERNELLLLARANGRSSWTLPQLTTFPSPSPPWTIYLLPRSHWGLPLDRSPKTISLLQESQIQAMFPKAISKRSSCGGGAPPRSCDSEGPLFVRILKESLRRRRPLQAAPIQSPMFRSKL